MRETWRSGENSGKDGDSPHTYVGIEFFAKLLYFNTA